MIELLDTLQQWYAGQALVVLAVALIFIDYYFPTDWPAQLGYICFALGMFFLVPWGLMTSLLLGVLLWTVLAILHRFWFCKFLSNAPPKPEKVEQKLVYPE